jgi:hypothetical protein
MPKSYSLQIDKKQYFFDNADKCPWRILMSRKTRASEPTREGKFRVFIAEFGKPVLLIILLAWGYVHFSTTIKVYPNDRPVPEEVQDIPVPAE